MQDGFIKVATATPKIKVADCKFNQNSIISIIDAAAKDDVSLLVFPELCLTGYTCGDLFFQTTLIDGAKDALLNVVKSTQNKQMLVVVGVPFKNKNNLYNCAAVIYNGEVLALVPKTVIPNNQTRYFSNTTENSQIELFGKTIPFGKKIIFQNTNLTNFSFAVEIGEEAFSVFSPSLYHVANGANVIANLSAQCEIVGKADYITETVKNLSSRLVAGYLFANAGEGESTTDCVFSGKNLICENGKILNQSEPYSTGYIVSEIDTQLISNERLKLGTFPKQNDNYTALEFSLTQKKTKLTRKIRKTPFVPLDNTVTQHRFNGILTAQAQALSKRLSHTNAKTAVIGISGGLDSALALLVTARAMDLLGRPRTNITAISMPCFGTTKRTKTNAQILCECLGVNFSEIDISNSVKSHFNDISHDISNHDVTFENAQARERTQVLMDVANKTGGMVVGTGDLSELALGWATYNGDHMSMYGVNAGVPKTLVKHLVLFEAQNAQNQTLKTALLDIVDTPVSPELIPPSEDTITQKTEDLVGPYELHDFFIYYTLRFGFSPKKIYRLAKYAFGGDYTEETIKKWLTVFFRRFFNQQFKRSCLPDGVKIGSVSLSPRGDLKMPSDAVSTLWLEEINNL